MKKVAIYTTPTCVYCRQTKAFFAEHNVAYDEYNVAADATRRQELVSKSGQLGVPVITITNEAGPPAGETGKERVIIGYDREALSAALL